MRYLHTPPLTITVSLKINPSLWAKVERIACTRMTSMSEVVRNAIEDLRESESFREPLPKCSRCGVGVGAYVRWDGRRLCSECHRDDRAGSRVSP